MSNKSRIVNTYKKDFMDTLDHVNMVKQAMESCIKQEGVILEMELEIAFWHASSDKNYDLAQKISDQMVRNSSFNPLIKAGLLDMMDAGKITKEEYDKYHYPFKIGVDY